MNSLAFNPKGSNISNWHDMEQHYGPFSIPSARKENQSDCWVQRFL